MTEERSHAHTQAVQKNSPLEDDGETMDEILGNLNEPLNLQLAGDHTEMTSRYFKLQQREATKLYTFRDKNIHTFFNLLANFVACRLARQNSTQTQYSMDVFSCEILSSEPFLGGTYNQSVITYASPKPTSQGLELRLQGLLMREQMKALVAALLRFDTLEIKVENVDETASFLNWKCLVKAVCLTQSAVKCRFQLL